MMHATRAPQATSTTLTEAWTAFLQRRVMRLLLLHDPQIFCDQFRTFYTGSSLANHPLLQLYDQHIKLLALREELLDDILPRIHLQWSQRTEHLILQEQEPTRGSVDWQRTLERASNEIPGHTPLSFAIRQRHQHSALPENLLTVAILLHHRQLVQATLHLDQQKELFTTNERQMLANLEEHLARELAKPRQHALITAAQNSDLDSLLAQVKTQLLPGANPYRDLLD